MKRLALVTVTLVALAIGVAPSFASPSLLVTTSVSNRFLFFADSITANVTVAVDRRLADAGTVRVEPDFGAWDELAPTKVTSLSSGPIFRGTWSFSIACFADSCLPGSKLLRVDLAAVKVTVENTDGSLATAKQGWPSLFIAARFGRSTPGATPALDVNHVLPRATYRVPPADLALGLDIGGAVLAVAGLSTAGLAIVRRRRPARPDLTPPLLRALGLVRAAKSGRVDERRRAAGLLARTLADGGSTALAATASSVAWSVDDPSPARLEELAETVEAGDGGVS